jgi:hypothetical protein
LAETNKLKLDLLNNGIDFIQSGVEYFLHDEPDPRTHKYALLHLFSGLLLVLKERLRREHPALIFKEVRDAAIPTARTVDFEESIARLQACANVTLSEESKNLLRSAQRMRNVLEHYEFEIDLRQAQSIIGRLSEFTYCFMEDELGERLEDHLSSEVWGRMQDLRAIAKRLKAEETANWQRRAAKYVDFSDEQLAALADSIEPYHPKHNPDPQDFVHCGECGENTIVVTEDGDIGVCTNPECRELHEITYCLRCGDPMTEGDSLCDSCEEYIASQ